MAPKQFTLSNGIKVIFVSYPGSKMISTDVLIGAGGRYESKNNYGLSHFLEHMVFKGTEKYPTAQEYAKKIESVGGIINAYTCEDHTSYWNMVPSEHNHLAFEMLFELISKPLLNQEEIDMEKNVIIEEIRMANDDPYIFIVHNINKALWEGHPMECDVLGPEKNIKKMLQKDFKDYITEYYVSNNMVISVAGDIEEQKIKEDLENIFSKVKIGPKGNPKPYINNQKAPKLSLFNKDLKQSHAVIAYKTDGYKDKDKYAQRVLSTIVGSGMSSRLFEEVREKRGLAYTVRSEMDNFADTGFVAIYGGFNLDKTEEALEAIHNIIDESKEKLYVNEVEKAKEYLKGAIYYSLDGTQRASNRYGKNLMFSEENIKPEELIKEIENVSAEEVRETARKIFIPENKNLLILGPFKDKENFAKILNR